MKKFLLILSIITALTTFSQSIIVTKKADKNNLPTSKKFIFIDSTIDISNTQFVATILAKDDYRNTTIESLYFEILKQANKLGANCYKLKTFSRDTLKFSLNHKTVLTLDCYYASDSVLTANISKYEKNVVYVFGKEKKDDKTMTFKLNGETKSIKSGTYYKIVLEEGKEFKVNKGGPVGGATMWLHWKRDRQPSFYSLSSFGISGSNESSFPQNNGYNSGNIISFNTGRINPIADINLGLLLVQILGKRSQ